MPNNKPARKSSGQPSKKTGVASKKTRPPVANDQKKHEAADRKLARAVSKQEKQDEKEETRKKAESILMIPALNAGFSRQFFPVERTPDDFNCAVVILAITSFVMAFVPKRTATMANAVLGCFLEDLRNAMSGKRSSFQSAPKVWWEIRHAVSPCVAGGFSFTFEPCATTITYGPSTSFDTLGTQPITLVNTPVGALVGYDANISVSNADYDIASDVFGYIGKSMKVVPNPYEGSMNTDPSGFTVYNASTTASYSMGQQANTSFKALDYNAYNDMKIKTRWLGALKLAPQNSSADWPLRWAYMTSSASVEIGHRLLCDSLKLYEVKDFTPIIVPVSLFDLVTRTMKLFQQALKDGGVADNAITTVGSFQIAAYFANAICEWFAPWSQVAYPRGFTAGNPTAFYSATSGCMIQNIWKNKPIPAALAVNLSKLVPCADFEKKRVYYPVLQISGFNPADFPRTTYTVFSADGTAPYTSMINTNFCAFFDTTGVMAAALNKYAGFCPMRILPHLAPVDSLACSPMGYFYTGGTTYVVTSSHKPSDEERELFSMMVIPVLSGNNNATFFEHVRHGQFEHFTVLPDAFNTTSYYGFAAQNNNVISTSAKNLLDEFDSLQEANVSGSSGMLGTVGALASGYGIAKALPALPDVPQTITNALTWYSMYMAQRNRPRSGRGMV